MTYPPYLRDKARQLRSDSELTIDEIAERLAVSRTTVFYWVGDMPRPARCIARPTHAVGNKAMQAKYKRLRDEAQELGRLEFHRLAREPGFRDFVSLYVAEGHKRSRNSVSIANSDPAVIAVALSWIREFTRKQPVFAIQYHEDQDPDKLRRAWAAKLSIPDLAIRFLRKSNSGQLANRTWRSELGVLTATVHDTRFRSRLQGWVDSIRGLWLDSI